MFEKPHVSFWPLVVTLIVINASATLAGEQLLGGQRSILYESHGAAPAHRSGVVSSYDNQRHLQWLCAHMRENADLWGPDYVPGQDAWGRPVAPADISTPDSSVNGLEIVVDLPIGNGRGRQRDRTVSAEIVIDTSSGIVMVGGQPIGRALLADIQRNCGQ